MRVGAPDPALTPNAGLAAISELCDRLDVTGALDAAVGPIKQRDRGFGAGELLAGIAAAQLAGEDFLTGLDRQRADAAGPADHPGAGAGVHDRGGPGPAGHPGAVAGGGDGPGGGDRADAGTLLPAARAAALAGGPVTIDLDTTDVEVYGRKKRGVAYNHQGQRVGPAARGRPGRRPRSCWPLTWATAPMTRARPRRICCAGRWPPCPRRARASGRVAVRADAGYFAGQLARAAHDAHIGFAIGAKRIAPLWRLLAGIAEDDWHDAIDMDNAQVAVAEYCPDWWPANTALLIRRVLLDPAQVSADPRSRRRRTLHPDQRALPIPELARAGAIYAYSFHPDQPGRVQPGQGGGRRALVPAPHHGGEHLP